MVWFAAVIVLIALAGIWAYRREVEYRRRTGITRGERHDPGQDYVPPSPIVG